VNSSRLHVPPTNYRLGCKGRPFHKMRKKSGPQCSTAERVVKDIRRKTRKQHSAEEKILIVLEGLRGEECIAALCRREGIATSLYYS
jgi:transposase-like protein